MSELNQQEKYCIALMIVNGGELDYQSLMEMICEYKEDFSHLKESYIRAKKIKNVLSKLKNKGFIHEKDWIYRINPYMELGFIKESPLILQKAIKNNLEYRKNHILEFNTMYVEDVLFNEIDYDIVPFGLIENLQEAMRLLKLHSFDSVLVKCGKCVEIMINTINQHYDIFTKKQSIGNMIIQLKQDKFSEKFNEVYNLNMWITFLDGIGVVYKFRNIVGAHDSIEWREDQLAMSCLILTFYLVDLFLDEFNPRS